MNISLEVIIFYLLLIDSVAGNLMVWFGGDKWYVHHFRLFSRYFPPAKGWMTFYLILVLFIGYLLRQGEMLAF